MYIAVDLCALDAAMALTDAVDNAVQKRCEMLYIDRSPKQKIRLLPDERQAREYLEDDELIRLLKCLDKSFFPEYRDYVLIMLMLDSGTRVGETLSAENTQLDLHERSLHLPADKTKGRRSRTVFFSSKTASELRYWLQFRDRYCDSEFLFPVKQSGFTLQVSDFEKNFAKYCRRAGIKKRVSPHTLRNNFAKRCLLSGIHHVVGIHKDVVPVLYEACKYIGVRADLYDPIEEDVKAYLRGE